MHAGPERLVVAPVGRRLLRGLNRAGTGVFREFRWSYLPPLMVYLAAGITGLTAIVGTFFVKEYLGLSAEFLAALGFWAGLPWALKMPLGHLVDLIWKRKAALVFLGAGLIAASLAIMIGLIAHPDAMAAYASHSAWFVASALLAPVGYVMQDVVADAMTIEAVPHLDDDGRPLSEERLRSMHTTMQTLGRVAYIGGGLVVSLVNVVMMDGVQALDEGARAAVYALMYEFALLIPVVSVSGVALAAVLRRRARRRMIAAGAEAGEVDRALRFSHSAPPVNWWVLGGGLVFAALSMATGIGEVPNGQELIFCASFAVIVTIMVKLVGTLEPRARSTLLGTAVVVFVFHALPGPGAGQTWWMIDELHFDQQFLAKLSMIADVLTLVCLFLFRRYMARASIYQVVGTVTILGTLLALPVVGMFYGLHEWTMAHTGGVVDARFIAVFNTAFESPLGQIANVPMLAWIANSAPVRLKATFFAVMASFANLGYSASHLLTKYLNQVFVVSREVSHAEGRLVIVPADYSDLGGLMVTVTVLALVLPFAAIGIVKAVRLRSG